ncbi:MAG: cation diffusion facilitator family transporter [Candidatus Celaenobacter polaris]|nr:cation diffusion facilitator family transporter [Candidatus Celaenobacter polaris]
MEHSLNNCTTEVENHDIKKVTWVGLFVNFILAAIKFIVGILGHSQAVVADAVHSISDMVTDIAVLVGVKYWSAPPDKDHPYGHWRIETIITGFIGLGLAAVAVGIGYNAIATLKDHCIETPKWIAIIGALVSIIVKELLYHWTVKVGRKVKSSALIANAWHHRSDALSSIPVLLAVGISVIKPEWAFVDRIGAIVVSLIILKVSWDIVFPALKKLSDSGVSDKETEQIRSLAMQVDGVKDAHAIRTRDAGHGIFVDMHVLVDGNISVSEGHDISEKVRDEIINKGHDVLDVVVHIEPYIEHKDNSVA